MSAFLVPLDPGLCLIPLEKAIVLIGRQSDCDVSLTHSRKVSRKHCCIAQVNSAYVIRDLGSTNGVFVNGNRVRREAGISLGDELAIGDVRFRLQSEATSKNGKHANESPREKNAGKVVMGPPPPSMDVPVPLPDNGADFAVEPSIPKMQKLSSRKRSDHDEEDDVVPLASDSF